VIYGNHRSPLTQSLFSYLAQAPPMMLLRQVGMPPWCRFSVFRPGLLTVSHWCGKYFHCFRRSLRMSVGIALGAGKLLCSLSSLLPPGSLVKSVQAIPDRQSCVPAASLSRPVGGYSNRGLFCSHVAVLCNLHKRSRMSHLCCLPEVLCNPHTIQDSAALPVRFTLSDG
jgi:hypothetical protein